MWFVRSAEHSVSISLKGHIPTWVVHLGVLGDSILGQPNISQISHYQPQSLPNSTQVQPCGSYGSSLLSTQCLGQDSESFVSVSYLEVLHKWLQGRHWNHVCNISYSEA